MELFMLLVAIIGSFATSLGVGSSTIAVVNFFVAIADGVVDPVERKMMGVTYIILRIAMVVLFLTLTAMTMYDARLMGRDSLTVELGALWTVLAVLYGNAILMTARIMPSTFGPAIQAGSWYTLGLLSAFAALDIALYSYGQFILGYVSLLVLAAAVINGVMTILKERKHS